MEKSSAFPAGFSLGLKLWLFFLLCFRFLGYPAFLCVGLGALGGLAGGLLSNWWTAKDLPSNRERAESEEAEPSLSQITKARSRKYHKSAILKDRRDQKRFSFPNWLTRKRNT